MSTTYTPSETYRTTPRVLTDDDPQNAASYNACFEQLADSVAWLHADSASADNLEKAANVYSPQIMPLIGRTNNDGFFLPLDDAWGRRIHVQSAGSDAGQRGRVWISLAGLLPAGMKIKHLGVWINPVNGRTDPPVGTDLPHFTLYRFAVSAAATAAPSVVAFGLDPSDTVEEYESPHVVALEYAEGSEHKISGSHYYWIEFEGEQFAASTFVAGTKVYAFSVGLVF